MTTLFGFYFRRVRFALASAVIRVLYALDKDVIVLTFDHYNELCGLGECAFCEGVTAVARLTFCDHCNSWHCPSCADEEEGIDLCCIYTCYK